MNTAHRWIRSAVVIAVSSSALAFYLMIIGSQFIGLQALLWNVIVAPLSVGTVAGMLLRGDSSVVTLIAAAIPVVPSVVFAYEPEKLYVAIVFVCALSAVSSVGARIGIRARIAICGSARRRWRPC